MGKGSAVLILAANVMVSAAWAGTMGAASKASSSTWLASLSAGPVWTQAGQSQTVHLTSDIVKHYAANHSTHSLFNTELFLAKQKSLSDSVQGQFGLAIAASSNAKLSGLILDDADARFDNYSYQYKVQNTRLAAKGKMLLNKGHWLTPWLSASVGLALNQAHDFTNTPLIFEAVPNNNFTAHTHLAFSYTLGAGVQKNMNEHWQLGLGYEFADWGKSQLGRALEQTLNKGLSLKHLYNNAILFNITYLA